jgi:hypothetical protein
MNEEISVTLINNTTSVQPVILFTEIFSIPPNLTGGQEQIYSWNISGESYAYFFSSTVVQIQIDTVPITNSSPIYVQPLSSLDVSGVVTALNSIGLGTFTNVGNTILVTSSGNYFYGNLSLSPPLIYQVTSNTPAVGLPPALEVSVNGSVVASIPNGINAQLVSSVGVAGDTIDVQYRVGAGALSWGFSITNYTTPVIFNTIYSTGGVGATLQNFTFTYPTQGNIFINLGITP